jgi:hypothetical protein
MTCSYRTLHVALWYRQSSILVSQPAASSLASTNIPYIFSATTTLLIQAPATATIIIIQSAAATAIVIQAAAAAIVI